MRLPKIVPTVAVLFMGVAFAADGPALQVSRTVPMTAAAVGSLKCEAGRFVPLELASGKPAMVEANDPDAVRVFELKPGGTLIGVRFDEPAGAEPREYSFPDAKGKVYVVLARPGGGIVTVRAFVNGEGDGPPKVAGAVNVEIEADRRKPKPNPTPPDPPPVTGKAAAFVIVEETADAAGNRAAFLSDPALSAVIKAQGLKYQTFDQDAAKDRFFPPALKGYADKAKGKKLPCLFVTDAAGKLLFEGDLPATGAELAALLAKYKG